MKRFLLGCVNGWVGAILGVLWAADVYITTTIGNFYFPGERTAFSNFIARPSGTLIVLVGGLIGGVALHLLGLALRQRFNEPQQTTELIEPPPIAKP